ncbi:MAG: hypothetical protein A3C36_01450 [Omnitrophica WOR_2 bacterium RIFCSPHIGHO2_02_FULL_52_10]|nr:MAG: hypothetical protein A3C36_01450 [Omnitrophica WOR_2 bacterium RIFCSPHIGHO2_02_FULL_52_10]
MSKLYILTIICLSGYILVKSRWFRAFIQAWRDAELFSKNEKLTMFDVRRLIIKGEKDLAVRVYCELFKTSAEEASRAVEDIERSIQPKDFEL